MSAQPIPSPHISDMPDADGAKPISAPVSAPVSGEVVPFSPLDRLPPPDTKRWVTRRKAEVVEAVRNGILTLEEACGRYKLSVEEFLSWQSLIERHGLAGLRATRLQDYRAGRAR